MKKLCITALMIGIPALSNAQVWGDLNADGKLSVADATRLIAEGRITLPLNELLGFILGTAAKDGHNYVDLGLTSGTLWANENMEGYYAWGETASKSSFNWRNYSHANGSSTTLTKYCTRTSFWGGDGSMDNKTKLQKNDDAPQVQWGTSWSSPSLTDWQELKQECQWQWITFNGKSGYKITGKNGNSIFLPAMGYKSSSTTKKADEGHYWMTEINSVTPYNAFEFYFSQTTIEPSAANQRAYGSTIRPVIRK